MYLAPSDGSRLWHGDIMSPFLPSGNEGYIRNRDVPNLSVTSSLDIAQVMSSDDTRGPWKAPQPEPRHNIMALQMLTSKRVTDKWHAKVVTFPLPQRKFADLGTSRDHR